MRFSLFAFNFHPAHGFRCSDVVECEKTARAARLPTEVPPYAAPLSTSHSKHSVFRKPEGVCPTNSNFDTKKKQFSERMLRMWSPVAGLFLWDGSACTTRLLSVRKTFWKIEYNIYASHADSQRINVVWISGAMKLFSQEIEREMMTSPSWYKLNWRILEIHFTKTENK